MLPYGGSIRLGDNCTVNPYTVIYGHGGVQIGDNVRIATHSVIVSANHVFSDPDQPIYQQGVTAEGIVIEDDVWIGANVTILDGAHIGHGCVVAAGSVVRGHHAPMSVLGGTPARVLKKRNAGDLVTPLP
ncbi:acyltransferase [Agromyces allii]|uniref:Acyltransferase n=1 Tax=Agromyces allii TaxID=393607 RepID=A0ABN2QMH4_9MICO